MKTFCTYLFVFNFVLSQAHAMIMIKRKEPVPLLRVIENFEAKVKQDPKNAHSAYVLARAYYLAFYNQQTDETKDFKLDGSIQPTWIDGNRYLKEAISKRAEEISISEMIKTKDKSMTKRQSLNKYNEIYNKTKQALIDARWRPKYLSNEKTIEYASKAKIYFEKAVQLNPDIAHYHLGLASLVEQATSYFQENNLKVDAFKMVNQQTILDHYWNAFEKSSRSDASNPNKLAFQGTVSYEAGKAWIRLGGNDSKKSDKIVRHEVTLSVRKPRGPKFITPLVITHASIRHKKDFVLENKKVEFDLDGDGRKEHWQWVSPETAFLVWDPNNQKQITSGRQLFGNFTFELIWEDGFQALSSLDDNQDQVIRGKELQGLSLWFDRNSNGISEENEVQAVTDHGIKSLKFVKVHAHDELLVNFEGVEYENLKTANLWDWVSVLKP